MSTRDSFSLIRQLFPRASDDEAGYLLWNATCYPIGSVSETNKQIRELAATVRPRKRGWQRRLNREYCRIDAELMAACKAVEAAETAEKAPKR